MIHEPDRAKQITAELSRVRAALPPVGAPPAKVEWIAQDAGLDVETCIRRLSRLCAAGEAWAKVQHGSLVARQAEPPARVVLATAAVETGLPRWVPTSEPKAGAL